MVLFILPMKCTIDLYLQSNFLKIKNACIKLFVKKSFSNVGSVDLPTHEFHLQTAL